MLLTDRSLSNKGYQNHLFWFWGIVNDCIETVLLSVLLSTNCSFLYFWQWWKNQLQPTCHQSNRLLRCQSSSFGRMWANSAISLPSSVSEGNPLASRSHPHKTPPGQSAPVAPAISVSEGNPLASRSHQYETPPGQSAPVAPAISVSEGNPLASRSHQHATPPGRSTSVTYYTMPGQVTFDSYVTPVRHSSVMDSTPSSRFTASRNIVQPRYPEEFPQQLSGTKLLLYICNIIRVCLDCMLVCIMYT